MSKRFFFLFFISGLVLLNGCLKEHSLENGNSPSEGSLKDDGTGDCLPKVVAGAYVVGTALVGTTNYIEVQVDVTKVGSYTIYTDTVNGMHFRGSGVFTATGLATVRLSGIGTPVAVGISNFIVNYGISGCTIAVTVSGSFGTFTLDGAPGGCMGAAVAGTYTAGTVLTSANTVTINVNVTSPGAYTISTAPASNGMIFTGSGTFTATGPQAIVLSAAGTTPVTAVTTSIPVMVGSSACSFTVNVVAAASPATFTINCATAVVNGTYTVLTPLSAATNTISLPVTVTTPGAYTISATLNGMAFSASGTFTTATAQTVTLAGTGTPTTQGPNSIPVTGATAGCNITVNVNPATTGTATFTVNCASAIPNGTYTAGVALTAANTITIDVNVTVAGTYTITTTATNGMTFTASGTFATATAQTVTLNPTAGSTPTVEGTFTIPIPGTPLCSFSLTVDPAVPTFGTWSFKVGTTTYSGTIFDALLDNSAAPILDFSFGGDNPAGDELDITIFDFTGGIQANEQYNCAGVSTNVGFVNFFGATGTTYDADPSVMGNTVIVKITSHNTSTKTIVGTFSGNAQLNGGATFSNITQGTFTATYP